MQRRMQVSLVVFSLKLSLQDSGEYLVFPVTPTYLKNVYQKPPFPGSSQITASQGIRWNIEEIDESLLLNESIERQTTCELELDAKADDILNPNMDKGDQNYLSAKGYMVCNFERRLFQMDSC